MSSNRSPDDSRSLAWPAELDQCVEAFQAALARGRRPSLEDFLPAGPATVVLAELVHSELVFRLNQGEPARVEEYLARYPRLAGDPAVVDLVVAEYTIRHQRESTLNWGSYLERFPDYRDTLAARLPKVGESRSQTGDITLPSPTASGPAGAADLPCVPGYEILSELGRGAMGVVYKARQIALNRLVALKMLHTSWRTNAAQRARFRVEVETIALLQHPNIVQVYDVGTHEGRPFFIMEFLEGGSLADSCQGRPQQANAAAELVETLARAMFAVHAKGIVHRDLKPSNIVRTADGRPKITDFGLARHEATGLTATGDLLGTPSYMSPEQAAGKVREVGSAADVYALGAILYEQLTGRPPFRGVSMMDVVRQVQDSDPVAPRRMEARTPRDLETICLKCLRKESGRRYATAGELADDLRRFRNGEPIQARPPAWPERLARWVRRHPAAAVLLVAVALLAVTIPLALLGHTLQLREAFDRAQRESDKARDAQAVAQVKETEARDAQAVAQVKETEARASRYASDLL
ncbi:MAG TPA: serine/threonine-protein kinase, partial [Gemmataceae bacterium]|nr:serine/threonine-protein kinase [Gemmataceae bacterium]